MATRINGSVGRNASKYKWYEDYTVTEDNTNMRYVVNVKCYLYIASGWSFNMGSESDLVGIDIDGTLNQKTLTGLSKSAGTHLFHELNKYEAYSATARSVYVASAITDIYASGRGPGACKAKGFAPLPARYSTAGTLKATAKTEDSVTVTLSGIPSAVRYARTLKWKYKLSSASSYTSAGTTSIGATSTTTSHAKTFTGLIPGKSYDFAVEIVATPNGKLMTTKTVTAATSAAAGTLSVTDKSEVHITAAVSGIKATAPYARTLKFYYKLSTASSWSSVAKTYTIAAGATAASSYSYKFPGLTAGKQYQVKVEMATGSTVYKTLTSGNVTTTWSDLPVANISKVVQTVGTANLKVYWTRDKTTANTTYKLYYKRGSGSVVLYGTYTAPPSGGYTSVTIPASEPVPADGERIQFYITSSHANAQYPATSNTVTVSMAMKFRWTYAKVQHGNYILTNDEWNNLIDFINGKKGTSLTHVAEGDTVTATRFNNAKNAIGILGMPDKEPYDSITAGDLLAIETAVNA